MKPYFVAVQVCGNTQCSLEPKLKMTNILPFVSERLTDSSMVIYFRDPPATNKAVNNRNKLGCDERSQTVIKQSPVHLSEELTTTSSGTSCSPCLAQSDSAVSHVSSVYFCPTFSSDPEPPVFCRSQDNKEDVLNLDMTHKPIITGLLLDSDKGKTTEELKSDIDAALANVFSGIEFLNGTSVEHRELRAVVSEPGVRHRPDLVSDLPASFVPSTVQKSVSTGATAKILASETKTPRVDLASRHDRRTPTFHEKVTIVSKEKASRPQSGSFHQVEKTRQRSTTPEGRQCTKVASVTPRTNRHSLVPTVESDVSRPSAHSHDTSELMGPHSFNQEFEVWVNRHSMLPVNAVSPGANFRENSSPQIFYRDDIVAVPVESARHLRSPFSGTSAGAGPAPVTVKPPAPKAPPQQMSISASPKRSEPKPNEILEDCKPSFI